MTNSIHWRTHFVELIVVFIGITAAFMLNNWREDQKDRAEEQQYISSFLAEIDSDGIRLDTIIVHSERKLTMIARAISSMGSEELPRDSIIAVISQMVQISLFFPKTNIYESIKYSGNFNLIEDYALRTKLIGYYESFEGKRLVEEYYKLYINTYIIPFLFEHLDMAKGEILSSELPRPQRLQNLIIGYYQLLQQVIDNYRTIATVNKELVTEIRDRYPVPMN